MEKTVNTESQNGWGWKGPLEVTWSTIPAQAGPPTTSCPRPCSYSFWTPPKLETPQPLRATCSMLGHPHSEKNISWCSDRSPCVSLCDHCLLPYHWAPL